MVMGRASSVQDALRIATEDGFTVAFSDSMAGPYLTIDIAKGPWESRIHYSDRGRSDAYVFANVYAMIEHKKREAAIVLKQWAERKEVNGEGPSE